MAYTLVHDHVSTDMIEALEQMLKTARAGHGNGMIVGMMMHRRKYFVACVGEAVKDPTFARGMCAALDDEIRSIVQGRAGGQTTL